MSEIVLELEICPGSYREGMILEDEIGKLVKEATEKLKDFQIGQGNRYLKVVGVRVETPESLISGKSKIPKEIKLALIDATAKANWFEDIYNNQGLAWKYSDSCWDIEEGGAADKAKNRYIEDARKGLEARYEELR